ncbi:hypothetical protein QE152_g8844 [Popillia japonica]|uniref:Uncharacterized protein n=1 Tax=Popillia japonica TaxID=7064 RepID=A0AAW1LX06_POPJA
MYAEWMAALKEFAKVSQCSALFTILLYNMYAEWMAALKEFAKVSQCSALFTIPWLFCDSNTPVGGLRKEWAFRETDLSLTRRHPWLFCDSNTPVGGLRKEWAFRETDLSLTRRQMEDIPFRSRVIYHWNSYFA